MADTVKLESLLKNYTKEGELFESFSDNRVQCHACGYNCTIAEGKTGVCKVRFNKAGKLYVPYGYVSAINVDPIEKKPFYHVMPGSSALSFGMLGCNFHCLFCQNWISSQIIRDPEAISEINEIGASKIIELAKHYKTPIITSTYNEPLITSEWAHDIFKLAVEEKIKCGYVSNGYASPQVIDYLKPYTELFKVDLKSLSEERYRECGGKLSVVLKTIELLKQKEFWIEVVTLVVPDFNDSDEELRSIAKFLASVSMDIPWHVTAFHPDYQMQDKENTPAKTLVRAAKIGYAAGLKYVYAGNLPGMTESYENTYCPSCKTLLIKRSGFFVSKNAITDGACPKCSREIAGIWE